MRLYDLARVMRSKNAGPFTLTVDLMFAERGEFDLALAALEPAAIGEMYGVEPDAVRIVPFERVLTIKVTMPRAWASSGAPGDVDVYGSGQHFPLGDIEV